jgi:hypothetical protein
MMTVIPLLPVSVTITADQNNICEGTGITFTAIPVNGGPTPSYQWYLNAVPVGSNQPVFACIPDNNAQIYVIMTSSLGCVAGNPAVSNIITTVVYPIPPTPVASVNGQFLESSAPAGNQWYFNGSMIPGATEQTYFATQSGWYWTVVTLNGCVSDTSNHIYLVIVGMENNSAENSFRVFPVPNEGAFNVSTFCQCEGMFTISLYNDLGEKIREMRNEMQQGGYNSIVDFRPLADGIYSVVFRCGDHQAVKRIIVITR